MMNRFTKIYLLFFLLIFYFISQETISQNTCPKVSYKPIKNYFALVDKSSVAPLYVDSNDFKVAKVATDFFAKDIHQITNRKPIVFNSARTSSDNIVIIGTVGKSEWIDRLISEKKLEVSSILNKWESFIITTIKNPFPGAKSALVIAGSDRRGTAFGVFTLSEKIGVSPWYWWADVIPKKHDQLYIQSGYFRQGSPSVKYRGIFINDERFGGLAQWAAKTFDKDLGNVGPKTYQKVFELLLRLKANYLWPAMHNGTRAFNSFPENAKLADDYAIVMGSSHCEQMLRNNEGEWKTVPSYGDFNYGTNRETMLKYWEDRVKANGIYENTYTLGLRGVHDYVMEGAKTLEEQVEYTKLAVKDQRDLLRNHVNNDLTKVPQVLCAYKEVLAIYQNGLNLAEDVTLLWADDNHGFIRQLSNPDEQKRKGGSGVYYHLSYHGDPDSWLWLSSLSPALIAFEMTKAYQYGANKIWVFNVGDIKPAEKELTFAMEMAWDVKRWTPYNAHTYIQYWAAKTFGIHSSDEISIIMEEYYRLAAKGKEHHVRWNDYTEKEIVERINAYKVISKKAELVQTLIPKHLLDAYYQLILYPVIGAGLMNEYLLLGRRSLYYAGIGNDIAMKDAERCKEVYDELNTITDKYNHNIAGGKWNNFFKWRTYDNLKSTTFDLDVATSTKIAKGKQTPIAMLFDFQDKFPGKVEFKSNKADSVPIWIQSTTPIKNKSFTPSDNIFCKLNVNNTKVDGISKPIGNIWHATAIGPLWNKMGEFNLKEGSNRIEISELKKESIIHAMYIGNQPPFVNQPKESIPAHQFLKKQNAKSAKISVNKGLGYSDGVLVDPFTAPSFTDKTYTEAPWVEYSVELTKGENTIEIRTLPTQRIHSGRDVQFAVSINNSKPFFYSIQADEFSPEWQKNVLRGYAKNSFHYQAQKTKKINIRIYLLDTGLVLQELVIYANRKPTSGQN